MINYIFQLITNSNELLNYLLKPIIHFIIGVHCYFNQPIDNLPNSITYLKYKNNRYYKFGHANIIEEINK